MVIKDIKTKKKNLLGVAPIFNHILVCCFYLLVTYLQGFSQMLPVQKCVVLVLVPEPLK